MSQPHILTLAEIRNGTGFRRGQRFVTHEDYEVVERLLSALLLDCYEPLGETTGPHPYPHLRCRHCEARGDEGGTDATVTHEKWCIVPQIVAMRAEKVHG